MFSGDKKVFYFPEMGAVSVLVPILDPYSALKKVPDQSLILFVQTYVFLNLKTTYQVLGYMFSGDIKKEVIAHL